MIINKTKKKLLIDKQLICRNLFSKGFGLMFRKKPDYGMIFEFETEKKIALTMWFVFFPIDVIWLDKNKRVVEIKKDFKPFSNYTPSQKAMYVIEFSCGVLKNTSEGDLIHWKWI